MQQILINLRLKVKKYLISNIGGKLKIEANNYDLAKSELNKDIEILNKYFATGEEEILSKLEIDKINMDNGLQEILDSKIIIKEGNESSIKFLSDSPIDINNIKSLDINGEIISFQ